MPAGRVRNYRDLRLWQRGLALAKAVYKVSARFPAAERFGLTSQLRRAAVSVPSNIAEGHARVHDSEFRQFLYVAIGSLAEVDTQLTLALELGYVPEEEFQELAALVTELKKMVRALANKLGQPD